MVPDAERVPGHGPLGSMREVMVLPTGTGGCGIIDAIRKKRKGCNTQERATDNERVICRPTWWGISQVRDAIVCLALFSKNKLCILRVYESGLERLSLVSLTGKQYVVDECGGVGVFYSPVLIRVALFWNGERDRAEEKKSWA